jgi:hypothetical protein
MTLYVKCRICGKRFKVNRPMVATYDRVINHIENIHPMEALPFLSEILEVDKQLPEEFHRIEG